MISVHLYFKQFLWTFGNFAPQINQKGATERKEHNTTDHDMVVVSELP